MEHALGCVLDTTNFIILVTVLHLHHEKNDVPANVGGTWTITILTIDKPNVSADIGLA